MAKKKKKETFKTFRNLEKSKFKTIKTTLKSVLLKHSEVQPLITDLVFEMNDLVIHTYQFIRLYILYCFHNNFYVVTYIFLIFLSIKYSLPLI